jgi:Heterodisulfide reductase, subunit C
MNEKDLKEEIERLSGVNVLKCMKCGKCSATCPNYDEMEYHPHQFVSMVEKGDIETLMKSKSLYRCLSCFACVERCPRQVEPGRLVEAVRVLVEREQGKSHMTPALMAERIEEDMPQQLLVSVMRKFNK